MRGFVEVRAENRAGEVFEHVSKCNYVLEQSRAYLLSHLYAGDMPLDPITGFQVGGGGTPPGNPEYPLSSENVDTTHSLNLPHTCLYETENNKLYDRSRLSVSIDGLDVAPESVTGQYPLSVTYEFYLDYEEANGLLINEAGLTTKSGLLFNHITFKAFPKTSDFRLHVKWTLEYV